MPTDAQEFFNEIFMRRFVDDWVMLQAFRRAAGRGLPAARSVEPAVNRRTLQALLDDPEHAGVFIAEPAGRGEFHSTAGTAMADDAVTKAEAAIDASSVIFARSILDGAAYDCCVVTAKVAPDDWEQRVTGRKVTLADVKALTYDELLRGNVDKFLDAVFTRELKAMEARKTVFRMSFRRNRRGELKSHTTASGTPPRRRRRADDSRSNPGLAECASPQRRCNWRRPLPRRTAPRR